MVCLVIDSTAFTAILVQFIKADELPLAPLASIGRAKDILKVHAWNGEKWHLSNRVARRDDHILIDLGGRSGEVIAVTPHGYSIVVIDEPVFHCFKH